VAASRLTEDVGGNRSEARILHEEFGDLHQRSHDAEWRATTAERAKSSVTTLLSDLSDLGFAWRDVARLVGVSVPAVQKWRKGEKASGENRLRLAGILAACDIITEHYMVEEIASWFELPLSSSAPVTPLDLYAHERADLVFEFASGHVDPETLLDQFEPDWRERYRSDYEVFEAADGHRSIRAKDRS
jgi:transcriptional regulator with XRE-family HTH domain